MDIGDVNEIPTTRRKLPSMQELGAFDFEPAVTPRSNGSAEPVNKLAAPTIPPATVVPPSRPPAAAAADPPPATRPRATTEQIRDALAKADPQTRKRLLRLIAGGRAVQQRDALHSNGRPPSAPLTMALPRPAVEGPAARAATPSARRPAQQSAGSPGPDKPRQKSERFDRTEQPLMQIDGNTDLLDALAPAVDEEQRKAALLAQLAAARTESVVAQPRTASHKVLFPAYDPREHGDDVHRPGRKGEGPVEGHFPAPRQPFQPSYRHADGRPMNEEESRVEEVLQEQRCEQTLEVLARDGVNGLLLSPRDLDAAVANGVLDAATAEVLWKTWSALRPVIHVIEDEPPSPAAAEEGPSGAIAACHMVDEDALVADSDVQPSPPAAPFVAGAADSLARAAGERPQHTLPATAPNPLAAEDGLAKSVRSQPIRPLTQDDAIARNAGSPAIPDLASVSPHPPNAGPRSENSVGGTAAAIDLPRLATPDAATLGQRIARSLGLLARVFVAGCVIASSAQIAWWCWRYVGFWLQP